MTAYEHYDKELKDGRLLAVSKAVSMSVNDKFKELSDVEKARRIANEAFKAGLEASRQAHMAIGCYC